MKSDTPGAEPSIRLDPIVYCELKLLVSERERALLFVENCQLRLVAAQAAAASAQEYVARALRDCGVDPGRNYRFDDGAHTLTAVPR